LRIAKRSAARWSAQISRLHREQVPDALGFFDPKKPEMLGDLLAEFYGDLAPGRAFRARREAAFALTRKRASDYGSRLLEMTVDAASTPEAETILPKSKEPESFLNQTPASSEEKNAYVKELKIRKPTRIPNYPPSDS